MFRIFDSHAHTYPDAIAEKACYNLSHFYNFAVKSKGTYEDLEEQANECGVCGFLIFAVATNAHQVEKVNNAIAETVKKSLSHGYKTVGFAGMHQDYPDFLKEIERAQQIGLSGVKLHPDIQEIDIDDKKLLPLYEILEYKKLKLYLHMGDDRTIFRYSSPDKLKRITKIFPDLKITAAHFGGYKSFDESVPVLKGTPNVNFDTSSSLWYMTEEKAVEIIRTLGSENVMFGTDYPVMTLKEEIERFMKLKLTEKEREDILWNNAAKYYGLEEIK